MVAGVKEALLAQVRGKDERERKEKIESITSGDLLKKKREELVDADRVRNAAIRKAFISLIKRFEAGEVKTPKYISDIRKEWEKLETQYSGRLSKDPEAQRAIEKVRSHVTRASKDIIGRREQKPV